MTKFKHDYTYEHMKIIKKHNSKQYLLTLTEIVIPTNISVSLRSTIILVEKEPKEATNSEKNM